MRNRKKMSRKGSRKMFSKSAKKAHKYNFTKKPMRGGHRL